MSVTYTKKRIDNGEVILERTETTSREEPKRKKLEAIDEDIQIITDDISRSQAELAEQEALKVTITGIR